MTSNYGQARNRSHGSKVVHLPPGVDRVVGRVGEQRLVDVEHPRGSRGARPGGGGQRAGGEREGVGGGDGGVGRVAGALHVVPHERLAARGDGAPGPRVRRLDGQPPAVAEERVAVAAGGDRRRDVRDRAEDGPGPARARARGGGRRGEREGEDEDEGKETHCAAAAAGEAGGHWIGGAEAWGRDGTGYSGGGVVGLCSVKRGMGRDWTVGPSY